MDVFTGQNIVSITIWILINLNLLKLFDNIPTINVFGPAMIIGTLVMVILKNKRDKRNISNLDKAIGHFKTTTIIFGILSVLLWFMLSSTGTIGSFGYPDDVTRIDTDAKVLYYMKQYSRAIERTSDVLMWFMFLFIWWFLTNLYVAINALKGNIVQIMEHQAA